MSANSSEAEVQEALKGFLGAFANLDWERFVTCWSSNPSVFFPGDRARTDGRDEVLSKFRSRFDEIRGRSPGPPYLDLTPCNLRIDTHNDSALVTFTLRNASGPPPLRSLLFVREGDAWKLGHIHATP